MNNNLRSYVTYTYSDGNLYINYKRKPLFKVAKETRVEGFKFAKDNEADILKLVAKNLKENGVVA